MTGLRALVLGGGGVAGIAWQTGILLGIADESAAAAQALLNSDVLLGTSAGSTVAAQIGSGLSLADLFARQVAEESAEIDPGVTIDAITDIFLAALWDPDATVSQKRKRIGRKRRRTLMCCSTEPATSGDCMCNGALPHLLRT